MSIYMTKYTLCSECWNLWDDEWKQ